MCKYTCTYIYTLVADWLKLNTIVQVKIWFQNRRSKYKKILKLLASELPPTSIATSASSATASSTHVSSTAGSQFDRLLSDVTSRQYPTPSFLSSTAWPMFSSPIASYREGYQNIPHRRTPLFSSASSSSAALFTESTAIPNIALRAVSVSGNRATSRTTSSLADTTCYSPTIEFRVHTTSQLTPSWLPVEQDPVRISDGGTEDGDGGIVRDTAIQRPRVSPKDGGWRVTMTTPTPDRDTRDEPMTSSFNDYQTPTATTSMTSSGRTVAASGFDGCYGNLGLLKTSATADFVDNEDTTATLRISTGVQHSAVWRNTTSLIDQCPMFT